MERKNLLNTLTKPVKALRRERRRLPKRALSLLLVVITVTALLPLQYIEVHGVDTFDVDGMEFMVEWDGHRRGTVYASCDYCDGEFGIDFDDESKEDAAYALIEEAFPYDCEHCRRCGPDLHCPRCGGCFDVDVEECWSCNTTVCSNCHEATDFCGVCFACCLEDTSEGDFNHHVDVTSTGIPGLSTICGSCYEDNSVCLWCNNVLSLGGDAMIIGNELGYEWCEDCSLCWDCYNSKSALRDAGHCIQCKECGTACDDCGYCDSCAEGKTHCPECGDCFPYGLLLCISGDDSHCYHCDKNYNSKCEQCRECTIATGTNICEDCGFCNECCLENSENAECSHGYCIESAEYEDHLCVECGYCPKDTECEYCGMCEDCQSDYHCVHNICPENTDEWEEHLCDFCGECFDLSELCEFCHMCEGCWDHCKHDICVEDPFYEDHICPECADCYELDEFCNYCHLCENCCRDNSSAMGCFHNICVDSAEFSKHYCFEHDQCSQFCDNGGCEHKRLSEKWSTNGVAHWKTCLDCGCSAKGSYHVDAGNVYISRVPDPLTKTNGVKQTKCVVCDKLMKSETIPYTTWKNDGSPYILTQPKDYRGYVGGDWVYDDENGWFYDLRYHTFTTASGGWACSYQWYRQVDDGAPEKLIDEIGALEYYERSGQKEVSGAKTDRLTVLVPFDSCHRSYKYYCVVSNSKGTETTRKAELKSEHLYNLFRKNDDGTTHSHACVGDDCTATEGRKQRHNYSDWVLVYPSTYEQQGLKMKTCRDCGAQDYKYLAKIEKNHSHIFNIYEGGSQGHWLECSCGVRKDDSTVYKHTFRNWITTEDPTETSYGERYRVCDICDYVEFGTIDKLPHTHKFDKLRNKNQNRYALPNGYVKDDCHGVYCAGCDAIKETPHHFKPWHISSEDKTLARRFCYDCNYTQTKNISGKYQIAVSVIDPYSSEEGGPADYTGPVCADPGQKVTLKAVPDAGYIVGSGDWSKNEMNSHYQYELSGKDVYLKNDDITDFKANADGSCTFTMPDGPVWIVMFPKQCNHRGKGTYTKTIEPTCADYGSTVKCCKICDSVMETLSRTEPKGHKMRYTRTVEKGDCETRDTIAVKCTVCGVSKLKYGDYRHDLQPLDNEQDPSCFKNGKESDWECADCGHFVRGEVRTAPREHNYGEWEVTEPSTNRIKGTEERHCLDCEAVQTRRLDYSGKDYRMTPDKNMVHFIYTYGDEVEPQTIEFESVGRDEANEITSLDIEFAEGSQYEKQASYTYKVIDGNKVQITPNLTAILMNDLNGVPEENKICNVNGDADTSVDYSDFKAVAHITFPKTSGKLEIEGARFETWSDHMQMWSKVPKNSGLVKTGAQLHIVKDVPANSVFDHWEVTDASGLVSEWFDWGWTDEYMIMPPNSVKLRAVYKERIKDRLDITGFTAPTANTPCSITAYIPDEYAYTVDHINWHESSGGRYLQPYDKFKPGVSYYAEIYVKPKDGYFFEKNIRISTVTVNGSEELVRGGYTSQGYYNVVTEDTEAAAKQKLNSVSLTVPMPNDGDSGSGEIQTALAEGYHGGVIADYMWSDSIENSETPYSSAFRSGETYYLNMLISATSNYEFDIEGGFVKTSVSVNGEAVEATPGAFGTLSVKIPYVIAKVSGDCSWDFDEENGILTISGNGAMCDYAPKGDNEINTPWYSFRDKITSVVIEDGVTYIGKSAFEGTNADKADIPASVAGIGVFAFGYKYENGAHTGVEGFEIYGAPGGAAQGYADTCPQFCTFKTGSGGMTGEVKWSVNLAAKTITFEGPGEMGDSQDWRAYRSDITKAVFKNGVTRIGNDALMLFENLDTIEFENCAVEAIGDYAFNKCAKLESIELPDSVQSFGEYAFSGSGLSELTVPKNASVIGKYAFMNSKIKTVYLLSRGIASVGLAAFRGNPITDVYFTGSQTEWNNMSIESYNEPLTGANKHYGYQPVTTVSDPATGISAAAKGECELEIIENPEDAPTYLLYQLGDELPGKIYDIDVTLNGHMLPPDNPPTIRIPCLNADAKVYRFEASGSLKNMNATFENGCLTFTPETMMTHQFVIAVPKVHTHTPSAVTGTAADCENPGSLDYFVCTGCKKLFRDEACTDEIAKADDLIIPAKGHVRGKTIVSDRVEPGCETAGHYRQTCDCTVCGKTIEDIIVDIPATGHDWEDPTYLWASGNGTVKAKRVCRHDDSHIEAETVDSEITQTAATCEANGLKKWTADFESGAFAAQTRTSVIPAAKHTHVEITRENETPATCTQSGSYTAVYRCLDCGEETDRIENVLSEPLGHDFSDEFTIDAQPTAQAEGSKSRHCEHCGTVTDVTVIPRLTRPFGDANCDGRVDVGDVTAIQRHLADVQILTGDALANADANGDGRVTIDDATLVQRYLAEFNVLFGKQT